MGVIIRPGSYLDAGDQALMLRKSGGTIVFSHSNRQSQEKVFFLGLFRFIFCTP